MAMLYSEGHVMVLPVVVGKLLKHDDTVRKYMMHQHTDSTLLPKRLQTSCSCKLLVG